jgi:acyl-CoA thioester hydrolase
MKYVQTARVHYLERIGMMPLDAGSQVGPVIASTSCHFRKQLFYPGKVVVCSTVDRIKNTSFHMSHHVYNEAQELIAEASDALVMFDYGRNTKHPIPEIFRSRIQALEGWDGEGS